MPRTTLSRTSTRRWAGLTAAALAAGLTGAGTAHAAGTSFTVTDASFSWALTPMAGAGSYVNGCNFLSAGVAGDTGSSAAWSTTNPTPGWASSAGNVTVTKPDANGVQNPTTWAGKCTAANGTTALTPATFGANQVTFANGTGTVDPTAGTASLHWTGGFTAAFYGGLTYWSASDPTLTVKADGTGTLTATLSGYGTSQSGGGWTTLTPVTATLATLHGITLSSSGFSVTPDYAGVTITVPAGKTAQATSGTNWGSFPQSFVDFQQLTGQSSFWYSSGGSTDSQKVALPITFGYAAAPAADLPESSLALLLPLAALGIGGATFVVRRRRSAAAL